MEINFLNPGDRGPLNRSTPDLLISVIEYYQIDKDEKITEFSWVTDIPITVENVSKLMQAGRARWKVENETFNILKNLG